jgi:hypothetical protein
VNKVAYKWTFLLLSSLWSDHVYTELVVLGSFRNGSLVYIEKCIYAYLAGWESPRSFQNGSNLVDLYLGGPT